jgi:hypothetical protein
MAITFSLSDDGTMDTVVECYCDKCKRTTFACCQKATRSLFHVAKKQHYV